MNWDNHILKVLMFLWEISQSVRVLKKENQALNALPLVKVEGIQEERDEATI